MTRKKTVPLYKRHWDDLSPSKKSRRIIDEWILKEVRRGKKSLTTAASEKHVTPISVVKNTHAFKKVGGFWVPTRSDRISFPMKGYVNGQELPIMTNDSRQRAKIRQYFNAVFKIWYKGETQLLESLKGLTVRDSQGHQYVLDTDSESVQDILSRYEESEFQGPNSI